MRLLGLAYAHHSASIACFLGALAGRAPHDEALFAMRIDADALLEVHGVALNADPFVGDLRRAWSELHVGRPHERWRRDRAGC